MQDLKDVKELLNISKSSGSKHNDRSSGERKSQENDSQTLLDSQENVLRKLSAVLSQSSHSTNIGDLEETLLRSMETGNSASNMDLEDPPEASSSRYYLRARTIVKQPKKKLKTQVRMPLSKSPKPSKTGKRDYQMLTVCDNAGREYSSAYPNDLEEYSQESVSMLQECYQENFKNDFPDLTETCMNSELDIYSDEEIEVDQVKSFRQEKMESSTQTNFLFSPSEVSQEKETIMAKHAQFISSIVKLKSALSSKKSISDKKLWAILQGGDFDDEESTCTMEMDALEQGQAVPKETIGYVLRSSDVDNVFRETVQILLKRLNDALREDFIKIACCWNNSVYEIAVEMLSQAVDCEAGIWKMVSSFLYEIIDSIQNDKAKNWLLESKTHFIISFCHSTRLSYSTINCVVKKLKKLKTIERPNESSVYQTNNSYFLLRILESSLEFLKSKISEERIAGILVKKPEGKNYNVLEMWRKHWNRSEEPEENKTGHEWKGAISGWCDGLDEILLHCVNHVPVLSIIVERCGDLAKEILKSCHSWDGVSDCTIQTVI